MRREWRGKRFRGEGTGGRSRKRRGGPRVSSLPDARDRPEAGRRDPPGRFPATASTGVHRRGRPADRHRQRPHPAKPDRDPAPAGDNLPRQPPATASRSRDGMPYCEGCRAGNRRRRRPATTLHDGRQCRGKPSEEEPERSSVEYRLERSHFSRAAGKSSTLCTPAPGGHSPGLFRQAGHRRGRRPGRPPGSSSQPDPTSPEESFASPARGVTISPGRRAGPVRPPRRSRSLHRRGA